MPAIKLVIIVERNLLSVSIFYCVTTFFSLWFSNVLFFLLRLASRVAWLDSGSWYRRLGWYIPVGCCGCGHWWFKPFSSPVVLMAAEPLQDAWRVTHASPPRTDHGCFMATVGEQLQWDPGKSATAELLLKPRPSSPPPSLSCFPNTVQVSPDSRGLRTFLSSSWPWNRTSCFPT